ncbi:MAG TPA: CvpA family protein [Aggregatilineales bacterium]|nr:CvpA family protein [Aggregatilineales bacterium]
MIQLASILWIMVAMFALIGFGRGWTREVVATAGIVLALFATWQFQPIILDPLTRGAADPQKFWFYTIIFVVITAFAYQTPGTAAQISQGRLWSHRREGLQERLLGMVIGGVNGYLVVGSVWYYLDRFNYPFPPYVYSPAPDSASFAMAQALPLNFLVQNNLLTILVVVLFLFVIVALI